MIKLIAIDLDGTLLDSRKQLSDANRQAIQQAVAQGVHVVLCTGRNLPGARPYFEQLALPQTAHHMIVNNGASLHETKSWQLLDGLTFHWNDLEQFALFNEAFDTQLTVFDSEHYYCVHPQPSQWVLDDAQLVFCPVTSIALHDLQHQTDLFNVMFLGAPHQVNHLQQHIPEEWWAQYSLVRSQPTIFEIMPKGADKGQALTRLCQHLGIAPSQVMTLGDGNNDIEMLQFAGLGVAMGNASDSVKAHADVVTESNDLAGVAQAIHRYVLS